MKELFALVEKLIKDKTLPLYGEIVIKFEAGRVVIAKKTESIKPN